MSAYRFPPLFSFLLTNGGNYKIIEIIEIIEEVK